MALTRPQFDLINLAQVAIDQENWMHFEEIHPILTASYQAEKISGNRATANELADSIRQLTKQYRTAIESIDPVNWVETDGGRTAAGFGSEMVGDCVVRAIAIGCELPYREVWEYFDAVQEKSPDEGVLSTVSAEFLKGMGWIERISSLRVDSAAYLIVDGIITCHLLGDGHMVAAKREKYLDSWNSGGLRTTHVWLSPDSPYR